MPSSSTVPHERLLTASNFRQTCGFCGCVFRVGITWKISYSYKTGQDTYTYSCPECRRDSRIKTSTMPEVKMISKRTDGRSDVCPGN